MFKIKDKSENIKTYYYVPPELLLDYLVKNLGTDNFDEKYFREGLKKENIHLVSQNYDNIVKVLCETYGKYNSNFKSEHWDIIIKSINPIQAIGENDLPALFYILNDNYILKKNFNICENSLSYLINETFKENNKKSKVLFNFFCYICYIKEILEIDLLEKIWPHVKNKDWLVNYIKDVDYLRSLKEIRYIDCYIKSMKEKSILCGFLNKKDIVNDSLCKKNKL